MAIGMAESLRELAVNSNVSLDLHGSAMDEEYDDDARKLDKIPK